MSGEVLDYWMRLMSDPKMKKPLLVVRHEYDADEIRMQLERFPESMFEEGIENKENFVAKLLYMHIPREVLWRFISGIAFYEAITMRQKSENVPAAENAKTPQNVNLHFEIINNKDTNIDKNFGPNIDNHDGGLLNLPDKGKC